MNLNALRYADDGVVDIEPKGRLSTKEGSLSLNLLGSHIAVRVTSSSTDDRFACRRYKLTDDIVQTRMTKSAHTKPASKKPASKKPASVHRRDTAYSTNVATGISTSTTHITANPVTRLESRSLGLHKRASRVRVPKGRIGFAKAHQEISAGGLITCTATLAIDEDKSKVLAHIYPGTHATTFKTWQE